MRAAAGVGDLRGAPGGGRSTGRRSDAGELAGRHREARDRGLRRADLGRRRPARGARRSLRQRRHAVVRAAAADPGRLHPASVVRDGRGRPGACVAVSRGRRPTSTTTPGWRTVLAEHYAGDDTNVRTLLGGVLAAYDGIERRGLRGEVGGLPPHRPAPDPRARVRRRARTRRWSSCSATSRPTGSPTTSPRAAAATSCGRSARRSTASRASG